MLDFIRVAAHIGLIQIQNHIQKTVLTSKMEAKITERKSMIDIDEIISILVKEKIGDKRPIVTKNIQELHEKIDWVYNLAKATINDWVASHPNEERVYSETSIEEDAFFITRLLIVK